MGAEISNFNESKLYINDQCIGSVENIEITSEFEVDEEFKPFSFPCEISGTLKVTKVSQEFKNMLKRLRNILKARRLDSIVKRTRKNRIKKKLVKRICKLKD